MTKPKTPDVDEAALARQAKIRTLQLLALRARLHTLEASIASLQRTHALSTQILDFITEYEADEDISILVKALDDGLAAHEKKTQP